MSKHKKTLFAPVVAPEKLHEKFKLVQTYEGSEPARWMLDDVYESFVDADGNFLEQFQSTGFDARFFELYLWAYLSRSGFTIDRNHDRPDFIVSLDGVTCSIEATTVNPSKSGALAGAKPLEEMSHEDLPDYQRHELPIRFGSPLVSKMAKRYWELPHCAGKPFVIAIQDFHEHGSLGFSDYALTSYLYGLTASASWSDSNELLLKSIPVAEHAAYGKTIPSSFSRCRVPRTSAPSCSRTVAPTQSSPGWGTSQGLATTSSLLCGMGSPTILIQVRGTRVCSFTTSTVRLSWNLGVTDWSSFTTPTPSTRCRSIGSPTRWTPIWRSRPSTPTITVGTCSLQAQLR
ncbi:MAG: hypothetical protein M5U25_13410 [Planctomycetota bacterium]|nr:hypothetical protein [Planctomycetota bacterium]